MPPTMDTRLILVSDAGNVEYYYCNTNSSSCLISWTRCYYITTDSFDTFVTSDAYNFTWTYTLQKVGQVSVLDFEKDTCQVDLYDIVGTLPGVLVEMVIPEDWE
jgi:hypothetical protein